MTLGSKVSLGVRVADPNPGYKAVSRPCTPERSVETTWHQPLSPERYASELENGTLVTGSQVRTSSCRGTATSTFAATPASTTRLHRRALVNASPFQHVARKGLCRVMCSDEEALLFEVPALLTDDVVEPV